tara:strand:- start:6539 stop:6757 length:219 start_codon:yes stop_codon:yes gene_type:complete
MKFSVTFKTPDTIDRSTQELREELSAYSEKSVDEIFKDIAEATALTEKFVKYGEVINIEFDTDTGTATVLEV